MKAAPDPSAQSVVTRKTTITETAPGAAGVQQVHFWDFLERCKQEDWERQKLLVYIYRAQNESYAGPLEQVDKCSGYIELSPGRIVQFDDQEAIEAGIREKHGGKFFRLILKRGRERIAEARVQNGDQPKFPAPGASSSSTASYSPGQQHHQNNPATDIASKAIDTVSQGNAQAIQVATNALASTAEMVARMSKLNTEAAAPANPLNDAMTRFMVLMMERMMNPVDPMTQLTNMLAVIDKLRPPSANDSTNPIVNKILDAGLDKVLNPPPPVNTGKPDILASLASYLPSVGNSIVQGIHEWRLAAEAQRDAIALQAGRPGATVQPIRPAAAPGATVRPISIPAKPNPTILQPPETPAEVPTYGAAGAIPQGADMRPPFAWTAGKIADIFQRPDTNAGEAADAAVGFLFEADPQMLKDLMTAENDPRQGRAAVMQIFEFPPLDVCKQNPQRLEEFVKWFFHYANEGMEEKADESAEPPAPTKVQ